MIEQRNPGNLVMGKREQIRENQILYIENFIDLFFFFLSSCLSLSLSLSLFQFRLECSEEKRQLINKSGKTKRERGKKNRHYNMRIYSIQEIRVASATRNNAKSKII